MRAPPSKRRLPEGIQVASDTETRRTYHQQLEVLREKLLEMASVVRENIERCTRAFVGGELDVLDSIVADDSEVDAIAAEIESGVYKILATQQPMASDLRFLVSLLRIVHEVERTGDLLVNIAKAGKQIYPHEIAKSLRGTIVSMGKQAQTMFSQAIAAFEKLDVKKAAALEQMDDVIDDFLRDLLRDIVKASDEEIEVSIRVALVGRFYERIADHSVNIGERVRFMVTGEFPVDQHGADAIEESS